LPWYTSPSRWLSDRTELDLFANVIVCKTPVGIPTRHTGVDLVVVRQNTEAEYSGLEHEVRWRGNGDWSFCQGSWAWPMQALIIAFGHVFLPHGSLHPLSDRSYLTVSLSYCRWPLGWSRALRSSPAPSLCALLSLPLTTLHE